MNAPERITVDAESVGLECVFVEADSEGHVQVGIGPIPPFRIRVDPVRSVEHACLLEISLRRTDHEERSPLSVAIITHCDMANQGWLVGAECRTFEFDYGQVGCLVAIDPSQLIEMPQRVLVRRTAGMLVWLELLDPLTAILPDPVESVLRSDLGAVAPIKRDDPVISFGVIVDADAVIFVAKEGHHFGLEALTVEVGPTEFDPRWI